MENFIITLVLTLKILASPHDEQINYLKRIGNAPVDELALEFEELAIMAPQMLDSGLITQNQYSAIEVLNKALDVSEYSNEVSFWSESALIESCEWMKIRELAKDCLEKFE